MNEKSIETFINYQLIKIKFTFRSFKLQQSVADKRVVVDDNYDWTDVAGDNWLRAALQKLSLGDRETIRPCGATEHDLDDREAAPDQGGSVVPDVETAHKVIRPEAHWLVRRM